MRRLELGSGFNPTDGFEHLDANPNAPHLEWLCAIDGPLPFADGTFDVLRAVDCLEHCSYRDTDRVLAEWARVCAPGAQVFVQVPDVETICRWFVHTPARLEHWVTDQGTVPCSAIDGFQWRVLGGHADGRYVDAGSDWKLNAHFSCWTQQSLRDAMQRAGFRFERPIESNGHPNLLGHAIRDERSI